MYESTVDAFHVTYKQELAASHALRSFLESFKTAHVFCVVDFDGITPSYAENHPNITVSKSKEKITARTNGLYIDAKKLSIYLEFLFGSINLSSSTFLMILEDDVDVKNSNIGKLSYDMNGINSSERLPLRVRIIISIFKQKNYIFSGYGGCGGSIIRKSILQVKTSEEWERTLRKFLWLFQRPIGSDELLSLMVMLSGGTLGNYDGFAETWENDIQNRLDLGFVSILHKDKSRYV